MDPRPLNILLVDDDPNEILLTEEALLSATWPARLSSVTQGRDALRYLRREGEYSDAARPDVVWLDLNMPGLDGHAVLEEIRSDPALTTLPVMILTSSRHPDDIQRAYASHANCYSVKEVDFDAFQEAVDSFIDFWGRRVSLPGAAGPP